MAKKTKTAVPINQNVLTIDNRQAPVNPALAVLSAIERASINPRVDVNKMKALLVMQKEVLAKISEDDYSIAMCACQMDIQPVARTAYNNHTKSYYAKLEDVDDSIRPIYTKHGFSLTSTSRDLGDGRQELITTVRHKGGHKESHILTGSLDNAGAKGTSNKTNIQGLGSTISYLRRYLTCMIFNVVLEDQDNDGNKAIAAPAKNAFAEAVSKANRPADLAELLEKTNAVMLVLSGIKTKSMRIEVINQNIELLQRLANSGNQRMVDDIHALAEEGE